MLYLKDMWALGSILYCGDFPNLRRPISKTETLMGIFGVPARKQQGIYLAPVVGTTAEVWPSSFFHFVFLWEIFLGCEVNEKIAFILLLHCLDFLFLRRKAQALLHSESVNGNGWPLFLSCFSVSVVRHSHSCWSLLQCKISGYSTPAKPQMDHCTINPVPPFKGSINVDSWVWAG